MRATLFCAMPCRERRLRWTAYALSVMLIVQTTACGSNPTKDEVQEGCDDYVSRLLSADGASTDRPAVFTYSTRKQRCAIAVPARRYTVSARVQWSNGWVEPVEITTNLATAAGDEYAVMTYEKEKGEAPVQKVTLSAYFTTPAKVAVVAMAVPIIVLIAVVTVPVILVAALFSRFERKSVQTPTPKKPESRPSKDCCFVWIRHARTGEVVAGDLPPLAAQRPAR